MEYLKNVSCMACDRKGHVKKECKHDTKENGGPLNTKEAMDKKYEELAAAKKARWEATQHFMGGSEIIGAEDNIPSFEEAIVGENEHDGQSYVMYAGNSSEIIVDIRDKNYVFNQTGSHKSMNQFDILCDNQSTCDVIVNG
jgi:hypothetical protein